MVFIIKKQISHDGKVIIAMCDKELLGMKIKQGGLQLDLTSNFYKGDEIEEVKALGIIMQGHILNSVGERSIAFLIKNKLITKKNVLKIKDVPYTQVLIIRDQCKEMR